MLIFLKGGALLVLTYCMQSPSNHYCNCTAFSLLRVERCHRRNTSADMGLVAPVFGSRCGLKPVAPVAADAMLVWPQALPVVLVSLSPSL